MAAVGQGECLVLNVGGIGVRSSIIDVATRWPLPTLPRTTYAAVAIVDEKDPAALRSRVGHAVVATLSGRLATSGLTPGTAIVAALIVSSTSVGVP